MEDHKEVSGTLTDASKAKMEDLEEVPGTFAGASKAKMEELEAGLSSIVGLEEVKVQLRKWAKGMILDEKRKAFGLKVGVRKLPHMAFLGNPGTGKTMVARILGRLLHLVGVLSTDRVTEVQHTDLVGEFVGHTGPKTRNKLQSNAS